MLSIRFAAVAALAVVAATPLASAQIAPAASGELDLVCRGQGVLHKMEQVPDGRNKKGERKTRTHSYDEPFRGMFRIRLRGDQADALAPEPMLSQLRLSGWRPIKKLHLSENAIDGKVDFGFLYAPVFHIDRYAGTLSLSGSMNSFEGTCQPYDASERQF